MPVNKKKWLSYIFGVLFLILVFIQVIPVDRRPPEDEGPIQLNEEIKPLLTDACFDCHSNETQWPWYSWFAPVSWLVSYDIHEARDHMNFSQWESYNPGVREHYYEKIMELVENEEMPLWRFTLLHPEARLNDQQRQKIIDWAEMRLEKATAPAEETGDSDETESSDGHEGHDH